VRHAVAINRWMVLVINAAVYAGRGNKTDKGGAAAWLDMLFFGNGTITPGNLQQRLHNSFNRNCLCGFAFVWRGVIL